jgi:transposase-like protein
MNSNNFNLIEGICEVLNQNGMDSMAKVMEILLNEAMKIERSKVLGASPYERTEERTGYANGFKDKSLQTRMGKLSLKIPQTRGIAFYPGCIEKGCRSERALKTSIAQMYLNGVSTRKVQKITEELCGYNITSSQVSRICKQLDEEINGIMNRKLGKFKYVYVDARYEKVRHNNSIRSNALIWAVGINEEGRKEVLGVSARLSEAEVHWRDFMQDLIERGLHGVELIISDDHKGLNQALVSTFPTVQRQRCYFHLKSNAQAYIPKKAMLPEIMSDLGDIYDASSKENALRAKYEIVKKYEKSAPEFSEWLDSNAEEAMTFFNFPKTHWKRIRTTNVMERNNREIKR